MSALYLNNRLVHYEVFGRGQPVIFLHSWVGSWRYWVSIMDQVAVGYRAYALDFWGFGESERETTDLSIEAYVQMLLDFMDDMGISKANLIGHGLGGMVALRAAREHPARFTRLLLVSTPLQGSILDSVTKRGTLSRLLGSGNPTSIWAKLIRQIPIDDSEIQQELYEDTESLNETVLVRVQQSIQSTDLLTTLQEINETIPLLAVYGEKDSIVPPDHTQIYPYFLVRKELDDDEGDEVEEDAVDDEESEAGEASDGNAPPPGKHRPHQLVVFPGANHFPFLEDSMTFSRMIMDFLTSKRDDLPIGLKEHWRRRVSQSEYL